jgi:hypothetical protein
MKRVIAYGIVFVVSVSILPFLDPDDGAFAVLSGIAIGFLIPLVDSALTMGMPLRIAFYSATRSRTKIRVSASYLFRIKIDDQFFLVKGSRYDQFQPVGGVYKLHESARGALASMHVQDDDFVPIDSVSRDDLRIHLPGSKLTSFVRWFESEKGRETGAWREFCEELVLSGSVAADLSPIALQQICSES